MSFNLSRSIVSAKVEIPRQVLMRGRQCTMFVQPVSIMILAFITLTGIAYAQEPGASAEYIDCGIVDQQKTRIGVSEAVTGRCSNNGLKVTCTLNEQSGWRCIGPGDTVSGFALEQVVGVACGCKSNPFQNSIPGN